MPVTAIAPDERRAVVLAIDHQATTYDITGAIDGPSGGGALTVGTMAAITGATVKPKIAMTGTIAPDGTIAYKHVGPLTPQALAGPFAEALKRAAAKPKG